MLPRDRLGPLRLGARRRGAARPVRLAGPRRLHAPRDLLEPVARKTQPELLALPREQAVAPPPQDDSAGAAAGDRAGGRACGGRGWRRLVRAGGDRAARALLPVPRARARPRRRLAADDHLELRE